MLLTKPRKFKRAIKNLIEYIDTSNGIDNYEEWREEVECQDIDPNDRAQFEDFINKLEFAGREIAEAYEGIDITLRSCNRVFKYMLREIK